MKSRVHPTYKTKYRVANWASYDRALVGRGAVTLWLAPEAIDAWAPGRVGPRGGQFKYSDLAIETALTLRLIFHLPLRQAEGFLNSLFGMMGIDRSAPDHTTLSRRSQHLDLTRRGVPPDERLHLIVDSTGLSIVGEGEWAAVKHGRRGKRGWKKLHVGVDRSGVLVAQALTEGNADAATTALTLIEAVEGDLASVTADAAYDTIAFYAAAGARGANVVVPPTKASSVSRRGRRSIARDRTIRMVKALGRRRWKQEAGYQRQARAENAFFRYKSIIGDGLRARTPGGRVAEALLVQPPESDDRPGQARVVRHRSVKRLWSGSGRANSDCRVAPEDCSPEALTRTGLGGFHHPALPLMWLMAMRPRFARESEARAEGIVPTTQRTSAR